MKKQAPTIPNDRTDDRALHPPLRQAQKWYGTLALVVAACASVILIASGYRALGKGLILGALFSVINFNLIAIALPLRFTHRRKSTLISLISITIRYAILALPLVWAHYDAQFAVSSTAVGLFMVQIVILGDQLWSRLRQPLEARY
jgi:hypothetical protein